MPTHLGITEIFMGLVFAGRRSPNEASPETLHPPYDDVMKYIRKAGSVDLDDLIEQFGVEVIQPAISAAQSVNGLGDKTNWGRNLKNAYQEEQFVAELDRAGRQHRQGKPIDYNRLKNAIRAREVGEAIGLKPLTDIKDNPIMQIPCGYAPIDKFWGGVPRQGVISLSGESGSGKTFFQSKFVASFVASHKKDSAAIYTLEMDDGEIKNRLLLCDDRLKNEDIAKRVLVNDQRVSVGDISREVCSRKDIKLVVIDFINLIVQGQVSDEAMGSIYTELMFLSKEQHVIILALAQLKQSFAGGVPHPSDSYFGKFAYQLGWSVWSIFNPSASFTRYSRSQIKELPYFDDDHIYLVGWKQRGGWQKKYPGPNAIAIELDENHIWGDKASYMKVQGGI